MSSRSRDHKNAMDTVGGNDLASSVHLEVGQPIEINELETIQGEAVAAKVPDYERDENDGSFETISIDSPKIKKDSFDKDETGGNKKFGWVLTGAHSKRGDSNSLHNVKGHDVDNIVGDAEEGEEMAAQNSEEQRQRYKADEVKRYRKLIQILVLVIGVIFIVDLVLLVLLLLK